MIIAINTYIQKGGGAEQVMLKNQFSRVGGH